VPHPAFRFTPMQCLHCQAFHRGARTASRPEDNPSLGFLVQSGFPEGLHSRYVERYLESWQKRLGCPYLGTIVKGQREGVRLMQPPPPGPI